MTRGAARNVVLVLIVSWIAPLPWPAVAVAQQPPVLVPLPSEPTSVPSEAFPSLPPSPNAGSDEVLPPLEEELWLHGGSYLYQPEGDRLGWPDDCGKSHHQLLRLPECWEEPRPLTGCQLFLGNDPIGQVDFGKWFGCDGFTWEPRLVVYGSYEVFVLVLEENNQRQDGIGHQALVDLDLRLTGTERFHVQLRPLGKKNSGGSFWQLNDPSFYDDNSTIAPDRYWVEGELYSVLGGMFDDPFTPRDIHVVAGRFPFALHNNLLMNDDIVGLAINKNTIFIPPLNNLNFQAFYGFDDVDAFDAASAEVFGVHASADYRRMFAEATYAYLAHSAHGARDANYAAGSLTRFFGPLSLAGRALYKWGDGAGRGDGQLYVLESNWTRAFSEAFHCRTGIEHGVFYVDAFKATSGWNSISGGNFDRIRSLFEVNPLVAISRQRNPDNTYGVAMGVQLFRHHEDESIIPEFAFEAPDEEATWGVGLRYFRKIGPRTFLEAFGVRTWSDDSSLEREGVFISTVWVL